MKPHRFAEIFPEVDSEERGFMKADIAANGLIEPITTILVSDNGQEEEQVLDGRHRDEICGELGIVPEYIQYEGDNALAFVVSKNMRRRHLSAGQKAMLAISLMEEADWTLPAAGAVEVVGVSMTSFRQARRIAKEKPHLAQQVRSGDLSVSRAHRLAFPPDHKIETTVRKSERPAGERIERELRWMSDCIGTCTRIAGGVTLSEKAVKRIIPLIENIHSKLAEFKLAIERDHEKGSRT